MPEEQVLQPSQTQSTEQNQQSAISQEVHQMMQLSLTGMKMPDELAAESTHGLPPDVTKPEPPATSGTNVQPEQPTFTFDILKEKFGYQSPEDVFKEIEELRGFKQNPVAEVEFENEDSEKLFKAFAKGDRKTVYNILAQQDRLEQFTQAEVNEDSASGIIKLGMQLKYKDLTPSEIEYKFNKQFSLPKEPVQRNDEIDEDFLERKAEWEERVNDIKMSKIIEAKLMKPELEAAKAKIVFPEVESDIDEDYLNYQRMVEESSKLSDEASKQYKTFTPNLFEVKVPFIDEANKISFEFKYEPDSESFNKTVEMVSDQEKLSEHFKNQDGTPDRKGFLEALHFGLNKEKIILEAIKQSKNATLKSQLPDNSIGGPQRQFPQSQEPSELDKLMKLSLNGYSR